MGDIPFSILHHKFKIMLTLLLLFSILFPSAVDVPQKNLPKTREICLDFSSNLKLTSYNVWGLPVSLPGHEDDKRFPQIADSLIRLAPDILCLQEVFSTEFRALNLPKLMDRYYYYSDYTCNQSIVPWVQRDCHGGLATFSKYPIVEEFFCPFPHSEGMRWEEKLGAKGCLLSKIQLPSGLVWVINTHLYSGPDADDEIIRMKQIKIINNAIQNLNTSLPVILAGDLNIAHPCLQNDVMTFPVHVYGFIEKEMKLNDTAADYGSDNQYYTIDPSINRYCDSIEGAQKLDYIFYKNGEGRGLKVMKNEIEMKGEAALSDHLAFSSHFSLW